MSSRDSEHYEDSHDMIERIRKLREAAEKKMNAFGDPADYDVRIIRGRKSELAAESEASSAKNSGAEGGQ
jgi:hypothetical protein